MIQASFFARGARSMRLNDIICTTLIPKLRAPYIIVLACPKVLPENPNCISIDSSTHLSTLQKNPAFQSTWHQNKTATKASSASTRPQSNPQNPRPQTSPRNSQRAAVQSKTVIAPTSTTQPEPSLAQTEEQDSKN